MNYQMPHRDLKQRKRQTTLLSVSKKNHWKIPPSSPQTSLNTLQFSRSNNKIDPFGSKLASQTMNCGWRTRSSGLPIVIKICERVTWVKEVFISPIVKTTNGNWKGPEWSHTSRFVFPAIYLEKINLLDSNIHRL